MHFSKTPLFLLLNVSFLPLAAQAQPDTGQAPIAPNPPNQAPGGNRGRGGFALNLTDAQRQQMEAQNRLWRDSQWRQQLIRAGIGDTVTQNVVVDFLGQQEAARQNLRNKWNTLLEAIRSQATTDTQLAVLLNDFRSALDEERARREAARIALDRKLELPKNPRLDARLMTSGLLGDEAAFIEGNNPGGRGGRGGFGGGFGGGRGF